MKLFLPDMHCVTDFHTQICTFQPRDTCCLTIPDGTSLLVLQIGYKQTTEQQTYTNKQRIHTLEQRTTIQGDKKTQLGKRKTYK